MSENDQNENPNAEKPAQPEGPKPGGLKRTFIDVAAFGGVHVIAWAGVMSGSPLVAAFAGAVVLPLYLTSGFPLISRVMGGNNPVASAMSNNTGLGLLAAMAKGISHGDKETIIVSSVMIALGAAIFGGGVADYQNSVAEQARWVEEMKHLPVLDSKTVVRTDVYTIATENCVNRHGNPLPQGSEVAVTYQGQKYKTICP